jgi:2,5-diketo-D-gluconate reductase B
MGLCRKHGIGIVAYSPLARGRVLEDDRLTKIGRRHDKSPAQVALRWLLQQPQVIAIPKGSSEEHIRQNFDVFDFELDGEEMAEIDKFDKRQRLIDPDWAPEWDF